MRIKYLIYLILLCFGLSLNLNAYQNENNNLENTLVLEGYTKNYNIRIENIENSKFKYIASSRKEISKKKQGIILTNGKFIENRDDKTKIFSFHNNEYEYRCKISYMNSSSPSLTLEVLKNNKILMNSPFIVIDYLNNEFLNKKIDKVNNIKEKSFLGFYSAFFLILSILVSLILLFKNRESDNRYTSGYKKLNILTLLTIIISALIVELLSFAPVYIYFLFTNDSVELIKYFILYISFGLITIVELFR